MINKYLLYNKLGYYRLLFRAAILLAFFTMLQISNIAPLSAGAFDYQRHISAQDFTLTQQAATVSIKWAKNLQAQSSRSVTCSSYTNS